MAARFEILRLGPTDVSLMRELNALFGATRTPEFHGPERSDEGYLRGLLARIDVIVLVASVGGKVVGGLVAFQLAPPDRIRREIHIHDLAVAAEHRRRNIATSLIRQLGGIAAERRASIIRAQADHGNGPAIALYEKLGKRKRVLHFDIEVPARR